MERENLHPIYSKWSLIQTGFKPRSDSSSQPQAHNHRNYIWLCNVVQGILFLKKKKGHLEGWKLNVTLVIEMPLTQFITLSFSSSDWEVRLLCWKT